MRTWADTATPGGGRTRLVLLLFAILDAFFLSGIIFGWPAVDVMLLHEGVYSDLCLRNDSSPTSASLNLASLSVLPDSDAAADPATSMSLGSKADAACSEQVEQLNIVFTVATTAAVALSLPIGVLLDKVGPRFVGVAGKLTITIGCILFAFGTNEPFLYLVGYTCIGVGGQLVNFGAMPLSVYFPLSVGMVFSLLNGAFDASSVVFFGFQIVHESLDVSLQHLFLLYSILPAISCVFTLLTAPDQQHILMAKQQQHNNADEGGQRRAYDGDVINSTTTAARGSVGVGSIAPSPPPPRLRSISPASLSPLTPPPPPLGPMLSQPSMLSPSPPSSSTPSFAHSLLSLNFLLSVVFASVLVLRVYFYISTVTQQLLWMSESEEEAEFYTKVFSFCLPLGAVLAMYPSMLILDRCRLWVSFTILSVWLTLFGVTCLIPQLFPLQLITFLSHTTGRPFMESAYPTFVSRRVPQQHFGRFLGVTAVCFAFVNLLQWPLVYMSETWFHGSYLVANCLLLIVSCIGTVPLCVYLYYEEERKGRGSGSGYRRGGRR